MLLLPLAAAAPFPESVELHWRIDVSAVVARVNALGDAEYLSVQPVTLDWRCVAGPATRKQEMVCTEPDGAQVRLLWTSEGGLRDVEPPGTWDYARDRNAKRAAAALELAPPACTVGEAWRQPGLHLLMATGETAGNTVATIDHRVTAVEGEVATVVSEGKGVMMVGSSANIELRAELSGHGEATWRCADGVLVHRTFSVEPTSIPAGLQGTVGHAITVALEP